MRLCGCHPRRLRIDSASSAPTLLYALCAACRLAFLSTRPDGLAMQEDRRPGKDGRGCTFHPFHALRCPTAGYVVPRRTIQARRRPKRRWACNRTIARQARWRRQVR